MASTEITILAFDLGGTKLLSALVSNGQVLEHSETVTERDAGPDVWVNKMSMIASSWQGKFSRVGIAATGQLFNGHWSAVNPNILDLPNNYPLVAKLEAAISQPVYAINDAQAAAWGEYNNGASNYQDMVFLTISTGIGGGIVSGGRLIEGRSGLAGHFGQIQMSGARAGHPIENDISGRWIASEAKRLGHEMEAVDVFKAAKLGKDWAQNIIQKSAIEIAHLCQNIQLMFDPHAIVIGGGIGMADGYLDQVSNHLASSPSGLTPKLIPATLGKDAGVLGVADLTSKSL